MSLLSVDFNLERNKGFFEPAYRRCSLGCVRYGGSLGYTSMPRGRMRGSWPSSWGRLKKHLRERSGNQESGPPPSPGTPRPLPEQSREFYQPVAESPPALVGRRSMTQDPRLDPPSFPPPGIYRPPLPFAIWAMLSIVFSSLHVQIRDVDFDLASNTTHGGPASLLQKSLALQLTGTPQDNLENSRTCCWASRFCTQETRASGASRAE